MGYENPNSNVLASGSARNHYGPKLINEAEQFGGQVSTGMYDKQATWTFDYNNLPVNGAGMMEAEIPNGAWIVQAYLVVETAMTGTSGTITLGLEEADGTLIDVDGLDVAVAQAVLIDNAVITMDGALIGTQIDADGQLLVTTGGTVTGGRFKVVVDYRQGDVSAVASYTAGGVKG